MSEAIIKTENLEKIYGMGNAQTHALRGVSMEVPKGSFSCIIGASGHGKSTLLNLISGLDSATSGKVYIDGVDITKLGGNKLAELRAEKIGFVFQFFNLLANLTAIENIETAMMFGKIPVKSQRKKAEELLELVGIADKAGAKPHELSGGQKQRVAIARALANDPGIIIMDEPTGNLDSVSGEEVLKHIFDIHKAGKTIIIVTHNSGLAQKAELIFEIRDGRLTK
ncbi:MAG: ABC transporter ATP-binding protein [Oscillospiraceae bacterium]|nr:ABC transporter ATP-binding protein [Oscillospiraceae bacterium]